MTKSRARPSVPLVSITLFLTLALPVGLGASTLRLVAVAQPLLAEGVIEIRDVQYCIDSFVPGDEVRLTCERNAIRNIGEDPEEDVEDRNAASKFALSLKVGQVWDGSVAFDTLVVTLDATRADSAALAKGLRTLPDSIVAATALCIRINAGRSHIRTKYIKLRVLGPARLHGLAGVFPVDQALPARMFDFGP